MHYTGVNDHNGINGHTYLFHGIAAETLTALTIAQHSPPHAAYPDTAACQAITALSLNVYEGAFTKPGNALAFPIVTLVSGDKQLAVHCTCDDTSGKLCAHQALVLMAVVQRTEFAIFFNKTLRDKKLRSFATDYGLADVADPDIFFSISYEENRLAITPRQASLIPVNAENLAAIKEAINISQPARQTGAAQATEEIIVVLKLHKYFRHLLMELYSAPVTKNHKIKNPLKALQPLDFLWQSEHPACVKFFAGIQKFQQHPDDKRQASDIEALRAVVKNPNGYRFYFHDQNISEQINATSLVATKLELFPGNIALFVKRIDDFYEVSGNVNLGKESFPINDIRLRFGYFLQLGANLYLPEQMETLGLIELFSKKKENILIHKSKYPEFRAAILNPLADQMEVNYTYILDATPKQLNQKGFQQPPEKLIYLSDSGNHITLTPVMRYADVEIPVRTRRHLYAWDKAGNEFKADRNEAEEVAFIALLIRQHAWFAEQLDSNDLNHFYLHREGFLNEDWFLNAFEEWRKQDIIILGFNELENNKLNPHKAKVDIKVMSGINWFNAVIQVGFGRKRASLKNLRKAVKNQSRYVQLDDGTLGIIPEEWLKKFEDYFNNGEIEDDETLLIAKTNYSAIDRYYDEQMQDEQLRQELRLYREKLSGFEQMKEVAPPEGLLATLRPYQQAGLNWLNFLDDFNFGGCLADDMGLGKSMQILAFILSQRNKVKHNTNLLVVPATLVFSWEQEIMKFAPSLKLHIIYGADRIKSISRFDQYELILTSYGTLLSDIALLKGYTFNYVFLDESQQIKNPETQRYKAVCLLQARNRIAITGTPVENNTFDIFSQLSFANPGLLGSKQHFKDIYSTPIDTFKVQKRTSELYQKIKPFILRRTKEEVAPELPEKTEMTIYCDMDAEQRRIYDAYEKEFREQISATTQEELKKSPMHVLKGLTRLRQICDSPALLGNEVILSTTPAKIEVLMEQITTKSPHHKILVFSQFVSMLNIIEQALSEKGIGSVKLTGATRNRGAVVNDFQENKDIRVFLISLKAGGTGLNLTQADYVYLVDPWWNPAVENQAIDRVHRIGQDKKVVAVRLICRDTVEEKMVNMQQSKRSLAEHLIKSDGSFMKVMDKEDLLQLLSH